MEKITIPKRYLDVAIITLKENTELAFKEARQRDRAIAQLIPHLKTKEEDRTKIMLSLCEKDGDKPRIENDRYVFKDDATYETCVKELDTLLEETVQIEVENASSLNKIIMETKYQPKVGETDLIDKLLEHVKATNAKAKKSSTSNSEEPA